MGIDLVAGSPVLLRNFQVNLSALPGERLARVGLCGRARVACVHKGNCRAEVRNPMTWPPPLVGETLAAHQAADGTVERQSRQLVPHCKVERTSGQPQPLGRCGMSIGLVAGNPVLLRSFQVNLSSLPSERLARSPSAPCARCVCSYRSWRSPDCSTPLPSDCKCMLATTSQLERFDTRLSVATHPHLRWGFPCCRTGRKLCAATRRKLPPWPKPLCVQPPRRPAR